MPTGLLNSNNDQIAIKVVSQFFPFLGITTWETHPPLAAQSSNGDFEACTAEPCVGAYLYDLICFSLRSRCDCLEGNFMVTSVGTGVELKLPQKRQRFFVREALPAHFITPFFISPFSMYSLIS